MSRGPTSRHAPAACPVAAGMGASSNRRARSAAVWALTTIVPGSAYGPQRLQHGEGGALGVAIDGHALAMSADLGELGVERESQGGAGRVLLTRPGGDLLHRDRGEGRVLEGILDRRDAEGRDEARRAELVHDPAEALDLLDDDLHGPAELRRTGLLSRGAEARPQERHASRLPADAGRRDARLGHERQRARIRGRFGRSADSGADLRAAGSGASRSQPVLLHAIAQGVPGNAELGGRPRDVPLDRAQRGEETLPLRVRVRLASLRAAPRRRSAHRASGPRDGRSPRIAGVTAAPSERSATRSITLPSSRTLPGHG